MQFFTTAGDGSDKPAVAMTPLIDIVFNTLVLFMVISVMYQMEYALDISVPKAAESKEQARSAGEIVINVLKDGSVIVNEKKLTHAQLKDVLLKVSSLFPNQPVIVRADRKTLHEYVIGVLDACAAANIWNIAFSTVKDAKK